MKEETPEDLQSKEEVWISLKAAIIEDLQTRGLEEGDIGEIIPSSKLVDLGLRDSLERRLHGFNWLNLVHVIDGLEEKFAIWIDHDRLLEFNTVEDIFKCLLKKVNKKRKRSDAKKK